HRRLVVQSLGLAFALCAVAYVLAPLGVALVAGPEFAATVPLFRVLLLSVFGSTAAVVMVAQWVSRGLFLTFSLYGLALGVVTVAGLYLLVPRYGLFGAAWLAVVSSVFSLFVNAGMAAWVESRWRREVRYAA
ncbi:MAG: hypothetical protein ICV87_04005, partial [Gemmatimonadetes bacterium]|nr:hypothetical protein [Gemmatimonadota bacterium]